jgi:hypothetical protein
LLPSPPFCKSKFPRLNSSTKAVVQPSSALRVFAAFFHRRFQGLVRVLHQPADLLVDIVKPRCAPRLWRAVSAISQGCC